MSDGEEPLAFAMVMRGFDELVRLHCSKEGAAEFIRAAHSFVVERLPAHRVLIAEGGGRLLGMIDVRDSSHVSLFFVESTERGRGVGRALFQSVVERSKLADAKQPGMTVNFSTWAGAIHEKLGLCRTGPVREPKVVRFVP
jgi:GNAT superfamily N-acetyltransferase